MLARNAVRSLRVCRTIGKSNNQLPLALPCDQPDSWNVDGILRSLRENGK